MQRGRTAAGTLARCEGREAELAASYHRMLLDNPNLAARSYSELIEAHDRGRLYFQGRLLCSVIRPRLLASESVEELSVVSNTIAGILERYGTALLASERGLDLIHASESEREIWSIDPGYEGFTLTSRLDAFVSDGNLHFVEYNAESPAGIGYCDRLSDVFESVPAVQRWSEDNIIERFHARKHLLDSILWAYRAWGGKDTPRIAIIDWDHVSTRRDFELCADYFRDTGVSTVITDPRNLSYRAGRLWCQGEEITLVYRRVLLHELLDKNEEVVDLLRAFRDGAICMVNSPRSKLLHKKTLFALLSERSLELPLSREEDTLIDRVIPWTRVVRGGMTAYHDHQVDCLRFILDQRHRLVLKPVDDYGGRGIVLGWETDEEQWEKAVEQAVDKHYVVQERVPIPDAEFPTWDDDGLKFVSMLVDTDPLLFRGRTASVLTRISSSALLNVSAGSGSTTPTFAVKEA